MQCHAETWGYIASIYTNLGKISLVIGAFCAALYIVFCLYTSRPLELSPTLAKMVAGFVLAPAVAMAFASIDPPALLACVTNLEIYILVGATSVIWITMSVLFPNGFTSRWIRVIGQKAQATTTNEEETRGESPPPAAS